MPDNPVNKVVIMAGGTGGHVYPALAVAQTLLACGWDVAWVGTHRGLEARVVPENGIVFFAMNARGFRGKGVTDRLRAVFGLLRSVVDAFMLLRRFRPSVVLGMGGYASVPGGLASALLRLPLVIHEQNAVPGTANRLLAPLARRVLMGLPSALGQNPRSTEVGNPLRLDIQSLYDCARVVPEAFTEGRPLRLLVLGGSLGSKPINSELPEALNALTPQQRDRIQIRHQCGAAHLESTRAAYAAVAATNVDVAAFIDDMAGAYAWADLVICRAGALTVSELGVTGTPSILIPLPYAIDDHQTRNAQVLCEAGGAQLLPQDELHAGRLEGLLMGFLDNPGRLAVLAGSARSTAKPEATARVVEALEGVLDVR